MTPRTLLSFFLLLWGVLPASAQQLGFDLPKSKYGLPVVSDLNIYKQIVRADPDNELVDLRQLIPGAKFDIRYATENNLLKRRLYPAPDAFMRRPAALALQRAHENLKKSGFGLMFHDGYRPYEVTVFFYETIKDTTFVADPRKGSKHNRGMAIDLTMYHLGTGKMVSMPSEYDETTPRAFHEYMEADSAALKHREILKNALTAVGFEIYPWEWWHYDYQDWQNCFTYDIWHKDIRRANRQLAAERRKAAK